MASCLSLTLPPSFLPPLAPAAAGAALLCFSLTAVATMPFARNAATAAGRLSASISSATLRPPARPLYANTAIEIVLRLRERHAQDFLHRRGAFQDLHQARLAQCLHPF